jgi:hypothetical protein
MERQIIEAHWGYISLPLKSGELGEKGKLACIDLAASGQIVKGRVATSLIAIGVFHETVVGDGIKKIHIKMFKEIQAIWWINDTGTPLTVADRGKAAFIKDDQTVSGDSTGRSALGMVLDVDPAKGVLVYSPPPRLPA